MSRVVQFFKNLVKNSLTVRVLTNKYVTDEELNYFAIYWWIIFSLIIVLIVGIILIYFP